MPLTQKIETACLQNNGNRAHCHIAMQNPKTGSALMMNQGERLHCNILG